ncbi:DNA damage-binding protein [Actinidia chinensis var. chinensis]|uniref:DNA damage-binding protein n=1 Tax=Actinidia chinensis var. chinensis TaxID=1590841 RepID=A0A2R6QRN0_ACTCC|nr:DNA damage-binding protein [Actinidia chinensis var. chinensis]
MAVSEEESSSAKSRSASNGVHYLAKCVLRGSVVLQVVQGHIRSPSSNDVVFGKETSIELVIVDDDGITQSICEQPVFGTIKDLAIIPWNEKFHARSPQMMGKDLLVVISDSGKLSCLTFSNEMHRFFPLQHIQLSAPGNSRYQVGRMLAVDPYGCFIAASAYEDRLSMFSVSMSAGTDIIDKRVFYPSDNEGDSSTSRGLTSICGTIWSMCFISDDFRHPSKEHNPVLAILLNRRGSFLNELLLLEWNTREQIVHVISQYAEAGPLAHDVVEVPHSCGFAILFRVGDALLMDLRDVHNPYCVYRMTLPASIEEHNFVEADEIFNVAASALLELGDVRKDDDPMSIDGESGNGKSNSSYVCSWSWEPGNGKNPRMIFCVDSGELFMIKISSESDGPRVDMSECLYKGLPYKALLWVEGGLLAALVEMGDGMVLKLEDGRLLCRSPIQNIAPILDMSVMDYHDEKHDQVFACCGMAPEGSLRIIRSGISVEKLLRTAPIYQGMTGTWTLKMKVTDSYHSFLVLSFVEQTRVLSVGLSFTDVTDTVGFQPDVCTLACGLVGDGLLAQIHQNAVRICLPTAAAQADGIPSSSPICTSWSPDNISISLGAVGHNLIVVATSNPSLLFILGVRYLSACHYEVYEMQHVSLQNELSCMSIPRKHFKQNPSTSCSNMVDKSLVDTLPDGVDIGSTFVIGTHKPSVEVLSFLPNKGLRVVAVGAISLTNSVGTAISGCVPQDVRLVLVDRLYVLSGLRNGMLLRFEWPTASAMSSFVSSSQRPCSSSCLLTPDAFLLKTTAPHSRAFELSEKSKDNPVHLQLIAIRRIGITPAFLIPLSDALDADVIALSDRPWLLQTARHSLSYTSISFQPSSHVTPVRSVECPKGILFVAENCLHLVEMVHTKRINVQKFHLGGTPRKVLYHSESRLLLVMRTELSHDSYSSDICCIDPVSGSVLSSFRLDPGETGKTMELVRVGNEQVLVVGTSLSAGPAIMPSGEAESTKGRLIVLCLENMHNSDSGSMTFCSKAGSSSQRSSPFREIVGYAAEQLSSSSLCSSPDDNSCDGMKLEETEPWHLRLAYSTIWSGMILAVCPYLDRYFLASAGNAFYVCGFPNDNPQRVRRFAVGRTRFMIMTLTAHFTRIAVGDCRDGILFYSYHEDARRLDQIYCDPVQRLVADCILMDIDTAVVSDRKGSIAVLSCSNQLEDSASPECNLTRSCSFYMGEIAMSIRKGSFSYKLPADDILKGCDVANTNMCLSHNSIMASTLLGSIVVFIPISREEYELLEVLQSRLVVHPLTAPILGNNHNEFRSRECSAGVPKILDGDMLAQFLELTSMQQEAVVALPLGSPDTVMFSSKPSSPTPITVNQVVRLLERVHYALN